MSDKREVNKGSVASTYGYVINGKFLKTSDSKLIELFRQHGVRVESVVNKNTKNYLIKNVKLKKLNKILSLKEVT